MNLVEDEGRLRERVAMLLETRNHVTLAEITTHYPITQGLAEVIGYIQLAARNNSQIDGDQSETLFIEQNQGEGETVTQVAVPLVTFRHPRSQ